MISIFAVEEIIAMTIEDIAEVAPVDIVDAILAMIEIAITTGEMKTEVIGIFGTATATDVEKINVVMIAGCHKEYKRMKNI